MNSHRHWTIATLCWFLVFFNVERVFPQVNLASYVYGLAALAGVSMLLFPAWRSHHFGLTALGFGILWIVGKCLLGYSVDLNELPIALTEAASLIISQYLCLKVAQNTDEFEIVCAQLLEVLRASSVADLEEAQPVLLEEIRRSRRYERPLSFISLMPGNVRSEVLSELVQQMARSLGREYVIGSISRILDETTKSHDLTVRVGDQFLILLPETPAEQAQLTAQRLQATVESRLGVHIDAKTYAFGTDELTLTGVLDRMKETSPRSGSQTQDVFELQPARSASDTVVSAAATN